jgi:hypothetical protein
MESPQERSIEKFYSENLPVQVRSVADTIWKMLYQEYGMDFEATEVTGSPVVEFQISEDYELSTETFAQIAETAAAPGIQISFNPDEQTILVTPLLN